MDRVLRVAEDSSDLIRMDEDELYDVIGIAPEDYSDYAYLADYDALSGRELVLVRAVDEEAAERISTLWNTASRQPAITCRMFTAP